MAAAVLDAADLDTVAGRRAAPARSSGSRAAAHADAVTHSRLATLNIRLRGLALAKLPAGEGTPEAVAVRNVYETYCVRWDFVFERTFERLGLRVRPGVTVHSLSMLAISMVEGFTIWDRVDPAAARSIGRPTGSDGQGQEWSLLSLGIDTLVGQLTELVEGSTEPLDGRTEGPGARAVLPDPAATGAEDTGIPE